MTSDNIPASRRPLTVRNENGAEIDCDKIADLWHIAMAIKDVAAGSPSGYVIADDDAEAILEVWRQAHALKAAFLRTVGKHPTAFDEAGANAEADYIESVDALAPGRNFNGNVRTFRDYCEMQERACFHYPKARARIRAVIDSQRDALRAIIADYHGHGDTASLATIAHVLNGSL